MVLATSITGANIDPDLCCHVALLGHRELTEPSKHFTGTRLTHWGRVTQICGFKLTIIGSDNGLSPGRRQTIIWTNAGIWSIRPRGTNFSEFLIAIHWFPFKKMHFKMSSAKWRELTTTNNYVQKRLRGQQPLLMGLSCHSSKMFHLLPVGRFDYLKLVIL